MSKLAGLWKILRRFKYFIVLLLFALIIGVLDENSVYVRLQRRNAIRELRAKIEYYQEMYERDTRLLEEMESNPETITEIAREKYYMQYPDEDVFVFQTDENADALKD